VRQQVPLWPDVSLSWGTWLRANPNMRKKGETDMNNIFYIVGVVVVVLFVAGYLLR
jgi:hypothetical protein